jgi:hypothetical protein
VLEESVEGGVVVERLRIWKLFVLIGSENCAVMSAVVTTLVGRGAGATVVSGTVLKTVGAGRAAEAIPAAKSSARAIVVNSSSVFLMIFLSFLIGVSCTKGSFS